MMSFCGNVVELVEKRKVIEDYEFIEWNNTNLQDINQTGLEIEVYIEKKVFSELEDKSLVIIDAAIGKIEGNKVGMLFMKKDKDVYG